jgi:multidrug efflux pump subunit AcrB
MELRIRQLEAHEGLAGSFKAIRRRALERLAPILMTALAAGTVLVPLALRIGHPEATGSTPVPAQESELRGCRSARPKA